MQKLSGALTVMFRGEERTLHRFAARPQRAAGEPRQRNHEDKFGQCNELADDAVAAGDERCGEGDEVAGDVCGEEPGEAKKARGVDEAAVERQKRGE